MEYHEDHEVDVSDAQRIVTSASHRVILLRQLDIRLGRPGDHASGVVHQPVFDAHGLERRHVTKAARHIHGADRHRSQRGFTLIEVLVSLAILTVIGGVVGAASSVELKALGVGGAGDRLAGAHDQEVFEQLSAKTSRAPPASRSPAEPRTAAALQGSPAQRSLPHAAARCCASGGHRCPTPRVTSLCTG